MALRVVGLLLLHGAAHALHQACPHTTNPNFTEVTDLSPQCFQQCPELCGAMDHLVAMHNKNISVEEMKLAMCRHPHMFGCAFHVETCQKVLQAGPQFAVELPTSWQELSEECHALAPPAGHSVCPHSTSPNFTEVTDLSPQCFQQCPELCGAMDHLVAMHNANTSVEEMKHAVCRHPRMFGCAFHVATCQKVLSVDALIGIDLPTSRQEFSEQCYALGPPGGHAVCPYSTSPNLTAVTDMSPQCFQQCPGLCGILDHVVAMNTSNTTADEMKGFMCKHPHMFQCAFHMGSCHEVLTNLSVPATFGQLRGECSWGRHLAVTEDPVHV